MAKNSLDRDIDRSLRFQITTALASILVLLGGFGGVAAYAEISAAVIGSGTVINAGRAKEVQHADGGIVSEIEVYDGERVEAGEVLFRLDGTVVRANLAIVTSQLLQLQAVEARLLAEQSRQTEIDFPASLGGQDDRTVLLRSGQIELLNARRATLDGRKAQLEEQIRQFHERIAALNAEQGAIAENLGLLEEQIEDIAHLHERGLVVDSQFITIKRERASLMGSHAALSSEIVEARQAIGERQLQMIQVDETFLEQVLTELEDKRVEIARLREERVAALDRLDRLDIRSPLSGFVHQLSVHTIGRVVAGGETLLQVVPDDDDLIVEAKLSPTDVDQVRPSQVARIRLTGLDQRVTPELYGNVLDVSPDLTTDQKTGMSYYTARIDIPEDQEARIDAKVLRPGMPAEVFVETNMRTILSYLAKPLHDQITHAMREN
ncbi:HlyD family type I secretion periplasmic adaptor subunit [Aureimonas mangrovi]|uniref:HlyD family type I secretion periplasmic adaptor subunit n=1 Tax=Aureimonas mangrovi TaxID=2758041 RepID=UPI00163D9313|nr:HlyD family type I secretion periplasmic adaptor subunit [Aureimonas mangrovi]